MIVLYLMNRYFSKLNDYDFQERWTKMISNSRNYLISALIYYFVAIYVISEVLLIGTDSVLLQLLILFITAIVYGGYYIRSILRFMSKQNTRMIQIQFGTQTETFSKDNVVG